MTVIAYYSCSAEGCQQDSPPVALEVFEGDEPGDLVAFPGQEHPSAVAREAGWHARETVGRCQPLCPSHLGQGCPFCIADELAHADTEPVLS